MEGRSTLDIRAWDFIEDVTFHEVCDCDDKAICLKALVGRAKALLADRDNPPVSLLKGRD